MPHFNMASFGHLAVGMMAGRFHSSGQRGAPRARCWTAILFFALLALLPDADVVLVALGMPDRGAAGHRGATHSLVTALVIGVAGGIVAWRLGWNGVRTAVAITIALASHGLLDALAKGGRGIPLFWPISEHRFWAPWRILPDAPRGIHFLSWRGLSAASLEFLYFLPVTVYALWPRAAAPGPVPPVAVVAATPPATAADAAPPSPPQLRESA
jgi:inner membrane protein